MATFQLLKLLKNAKILFYRKINLKEYSFFTTDISGFMVGCGAQPHLQKNREIAVNQIFPNWLFLFFLKVHFISGTKKAWI